MISPLMIHLRDLANIFLTVYENKNVMEDILVSMIVFIGKIYMWNVKSYSTNEITRSY